MVGRWENELQGEIKNCRRERRGHSYTDRDMEKRDKQEDRQRERKEGEEEKRVMEINEKKTQNGEP